VSDHNVCHVHVGDHVHVLGDHAHVLGDHAHVLGDHVDLVHASDLAEANEVLALQVEPVYENWN
jgi:hypothetical protein